MKRNHSWRKCSSDSTGRQTAGENEQRKEVQTADDQTGLVRDFVTLSMSQQGLVSRQSRLQFGGQISTAIDAQVVQRGCEIKRLETLAVGASIIINLKST